ncbi:MAG: hypothetical protein KatS3mg011_1564 [Acidimicrobiia bacterium]|nr:MAG: hypothetical protein KatS3mg011_1564 [Acidimicrobiia bacterium]
MPETTKCFCGAELVALDLDRLAESVVDHFGEFHPEIRLNPIAARNYLDAERRLTGPTQRLPELGEVETRPISPDLVDDVLEFFDRRVFADNPAWAMCYCMFHHLGGRDFPGWLERSWQENRADLEERIRTGRTTGVVAYVDGVLAGWCNCGPRAVFPDRARGVDDDRVGAVVCFAVAPPYRRHGLARLLLREAVRLLAGMGMTRVEGYPVEQPRDQAAAYVGTPELFASQGFVPDPDTPGVMTLGLGSPT